MTIRTTTLLHLDEATAIETKVIPGHDGITDPYAVLNFGIEATIFFRSPAQMRDLVNALTNTAQALEDALDPPIAIGRKETDACERGTTGCCVDHATADRMAPAPLHHESACATW